MRKWIKGAVMTDPEMIREDFRHAAKELHGFIDISEEDLFKIYQLAVKHARNRLKGDCVVETVMTHEVVSVQAKAHSHEAEALLFRHRISGLPVVDGENRVIGVITEKDFLYRMEDPELFTLMDRFKHFLHHKEIGKKILGEYVEDLMTTPAVTVTKGMTVRQIATLFVEKKINRVPVVDEEGKLVGIVSRADLVRALHQEEGSR